MPSNFCPLINSTCRDGCAFLTSTIDSYGKRIPVCLMAQHFRSGISAAQSLQTLTQNRNSKTAK